MYEPSLEHGDRRQSNKNRQFMGEKKKGLKTKRVSYQTAEECLVAKPDSVKSNDCENKASCETTYTGGEHR